MEWSSQERAVMTELERVLNAPAVDFEYDQLPGSYGGRLLNADLARELSRNYRTKYDRLAFTRCTYSSCSAYVLKRFGREIRAGAGPHGAVLFLAGGAASGKTTSVGDETIGLYDLIFDSNLADFKKASGLISLALDAGWEVDIDYIHRPYALAVQSMVDRALGSGRYIPLGPPSKLAKLHWNAQRTIVQLAKVFSDRSIGIDVYENLWTRQRPLDAQLIDLIDVDKNGRYYYNSIEELHEIEAEILDHCRAKNISEGAVFDALGEVEL